LHNVTDTTKSCNVGVNKANDRFRSVPALRTVLAVLPAAVRSVVS